MKTDNFFKVTATALTILIVACIASIVMLFINGAKPDILGNKADDPTTPDTVSSELGKTADYGQNYVNSIVFLCDKTMSEIKNAGVLRDGADTKQIFSGKDGELALDYNTSTAHIIFPYTGEELSIHDAVKETSPEYIVITLGINNGIRCSEEKFKEYYGKLIAAIKTASPETRVILQSVFPVSKNYEKKNSGVSPEKIDVVNRWIAELAASNGVRYLNTASVLKNEKGYLKPEYDSGNGLTLNAEGYGEVLYYIRTHGYK